MFRVTRLAPPVAMVHRVGRKRLAIVAVVGAFALVNIIPSNAGPCRAGDDATIDAYVDAQIGDAGYPGASIAVIRDGRVEHVHGTGPPTRPAARWCRTPRSSSARCRSRSLHSRSCDSSMPAASVSTRRSPGTCRVSGPPRRADADHDPRASRPYQRPARRGDDLSPPATWPFRSPRSRPSSRSPRRAPTTRMRTSTTSSSAAIIEAVTGQSYPEAMQTLVFEPLGDEHTTADLDDGPGARPG